jgi:iron complex outermembrane receptor protein
MRIYLLLSFILLGLTSRAQQFGTLKGNIHTSDGQPASYISVTLKGKALGATTNEKGEYSIKRVKPGSYIVVASAVGIQSAEKNITITTGDNTLDFTLVENNQTLSEVNVSKHQNKYANKKSEFISKMPLNNLENPQVYTSISKETFQDQMAFTIDDAMKNVPGLQTMWESTNRGGDGGAYYSMRGFVTQANLRNGISGSVTSRNDAANIESVEVIKGPSATLFGSTLTSYGGLINRVTKRPHDKFGGDATFALGSYDFYRGSADINIPIDQKNKIYTRLNTSYNYKGSFQDSGFDKGLFIAPSISYKPTDQLDFLFDAEIANGKNTGKPFVFMYFSGDSLGYNRADQSGINYKKSFANKDLQQRYKSTNFFAQMNYKFNDNWSSHTYASSSYSFSNGRLAYFFAIPNNLGDQTIPPGSDFISRGDQSTDNSKNYTYEIQQNFNGEFNLGSIRNRIVIGLDFFRQNSDQIFYSTDNFDVTAKDGSGANYSNYNEANLTAYYATNPASKYPLVFKTNIYSAYLSDVVNLTDKLSALAAIRIDRFDNKGDSNRDGTPPTNGFKQTAFSPKFGLVYQPVKDQVSVFANYQNGFTNKGSYTALQEGELTSKTAKLEQANQIEGGVKLNAFGGRLSSTISYYYIKVEDILRGNPANANAQIQDGNKISKGIDMEVITNPITGLNIIAGFSYNDNYLKNADADVEGRRDAYSSSPYLANIWATYKFINGAIKGFGVGFGGNYASDNKVVNSVSQGIFILPSYKVFNASLFYDHPKFRIGTTINNFTNQKYWTGYGTMNGQELRSFNGSLTYKF